MEEFPQLYLGKSIKYARPSFTGGMINALFVGKGGGLVGIEI